VPALATAAANPFTLAYSTPGEALMQYAHPGGLAVVMPPDPYRVPDLLRRFRAGGGELLVYVNLVDGAPAGQSNSQAHADLYGSANGTNPAYLWQPVRYNYSNLPLLDIRRGSAWSNHAVDFITRYIRTYPIDGFFLDVLGTRLYSSAWDGMSASERAAWTDGANDLVNRIRAAVGDQPILVANNFWQNGQPALNGFVSEHHPPSDGNVQAGLRYPWHQPVRNLIIASGASDAQAFRNVAGVTHVTAQSSYSTIEPPLWSFSALPTNRSVTPAPPAPPAPVPVAPAPRVEPGQTPAGGGRAKARRDRAARLLASTNLARGGIGSWVPLMQGKAALTFMRGAGPGGTSALRLRVRRGDGYVALGAVLPGTHQVTNRALVNLVRLRLAPHRARALMTVGGTTGSGFQVGVVRRTGGFRWAAWVALPNGRRASVVVSNVRAKLRQWTRLELRTAWGTAKGRAALLVDGKVVLRTAARDLSTATAIRSSIGLGRPSTKREEGLMYLRAARVVGR
jgi:hypothetical protein